MLRGKDGEVRGAALSLITNKGKKTVQKTRPETISPRAVAAESEQMSTWKAQVPKEQNLLPTTTRPEMASGTIRRWMKGM